MTKNLRRSWLYPRLTLALSLSGCASEPRTLHLSPELPEHVQSAFFDAADQWNLAQDAHRLIVSYRPDSHGKYTVNFWDLEGDPEKGGYVGYADSDGTVAIDHSVKEETAWYVVAHELGHHLGTSEHTHGGLMQDNLVSVLASDNGQCIDAEAAALFGGAGTCDK